MITVTKFDHKIGAITIGFIMRASGQLHIIHVIWDADSQATKTIGMDAVQNDAAYSDLSAKYTIDRLIRMATHLVIESKVYDRENQK